MVDSRISEKYVCDQEDTEMSEEKDELINTSRWDNWLSINKM